MRIPSTVFIRAFATRATSLLEEMSGISLLEGTKYPVIIDSDNKTSSKNLNIRLNTMEKAEYDRLINEARMRRGAPDHLLHEGEELDALYDKICETIRPNSCHLINKESILLGVNRKKDSTRIEVYYTRLRKQTQDQRRKIFERFTKKAEISSLREEKKRKKVEKLKQAQELREKNEQKERRLEQVRADMTHFQNKMEDALLACEASLPSSNNLKEAEDLDLQFLKRQYETMVENVEMMKTYESDPAYGNVAKQQIRRCEMLITRVCRFAASLGNISDKSDVDGGVAWATEHINATAGNFTEFSLVILVILVIGLCY